MGEGFGEGGGVLLFFCGFHTVLLPSNNHYFFLNGIFFSFVSPSFTGGPVYFSAFYFSHHFRFF